MQIDWQIKPFHELTVDQLYTVLQLRVEIFMLEQNCLYKEIDDCDQKAFHLMGYADKDIVLYARIFPPNHVYKNHAYPETRIGRIITHASVRGKGLGHALMQKAIDEMEKLFGKKESLLHAQLQLEKFYNTYGYVREGEITPGGADIPHISMRRKVQ
jgi:ElaA protein